MIIPLEFEEEKKKNEIEDKYMDIMNKIILLSNELKQESSLSLCNLYLYLLYTGNLSINKKFNYSADNIINDYGLNLMLGYGCCRNISDGLSDLLRKKEIKAYKVTTKFNKNRLTSNYHLNFVSSPFVEERKPDFFDFLRKFKPDFDILSLHVLNLILDNDKYFIYDATNGEILRLNKNKLDLLGNTGKMKIVELEWYEDDFKEAKKYLEEIEQRENICYDEFKDSIETDFSLYKKQNKLISDFYSDAHDNIESIVKYLEK